MKSWLAIPLLLVPLTLAAQPRAQVGGLVDVYFVPSATVEDSVPGFGSSERDADGGGVRARAPVSDFLRVTGEYETLGFDDSGPDRDQVRVGLEFGWGTPGGIGFEYIGIEEGSSEANGFGLYWRFGTFLSEVFEIYGQLGLIGLEDDASGRDLDGGEFGFGAAMDFLPNVGGFVDYRLTSLELEGTRLERDISEFRIGARLHF